MDTASLDKSINYFADQIKVIHANSGGNLMLEEVKCDVYNSKMRIKELGTVNSMGNGSYLINLWDTSVIEEVKKAIMNTLSLNAAQDNNALRVNFPPMTQEKRQEFVKMISRYAEDCLISIRNLRRDFISDVEKSLKEKLISEDEKKSQVNKIEAMIKQYNQKVDEMKNTKIAEITKI